MRFRPQRSKIIDADPQLKDAQSATPPCGCLGDRSATGEFDIASFSGRVSQARELWDQYWDSRGPRHARILDDGGDVPRRRKRHDFGVQMLLQAP